MVTDDVDDARVRLLGVMQVGETIAQSWSQVQERAGGLAGNAIVAVRSAGHYTFEQSEHAAHAWDAVQRRYEVHLRSARICKAHVDAFINKRVYQTFGAVHLIPLGCECKQ